MSNLLHKSLCTSLVFLKDEFLEAELLDQRIRMYLMASGTCCKIVLQKYGSSGLKFFKEKMYLTCRIRLGNHLLI